MLKRDFRVLLSTALPIAASAFSAPALTPACAQHYGYFIRKETDGIH